MADQLLISYCFSFFPKFLGGYYFIFPYEPLAQGVYSGNIPGLYCPRYFPSIAWYPRLSGHLGILLNTLGGYIWELPKCHSTPPSFLVPSEV